MFADGRQAWAARLVGIDVSGQLVHFDGVHAGGAGVAPGAHSPTSPPAAAKTGEGLETPRPERGGGRGLCMATLVLTHSLDGLLHSSC